MNFSSDSNHSTEKRSEDRYMSCIPVLIQKLHSSQICECTLINISQNGCAVRIEKGKIQFKTDEKFLLLMDPNLFDFKDENTIKFQCTCKRIDFEKNIIGATFVKNQKNNFEYLTKILNYFKKISENEY
ncbi:MAG: PilZ domain-containing protein [Spirobacillus cienkowskii]|jgi:hypothetical protein|uniref:PilZ domain-containing protein n=1 Tax=Spirobacillus cienkowskii TaxID=495820 RepID=A0A369KL73_9BACT|nr:MAG: PilZ domain-containing protein [Spirobacillus cienkowskii]